MASSDAFWRGLEAFKRITGGEESHHVVKGKGNVVAGRDVVLTGSSFERVFFDEIKGDDELRECGRARGLKGWNEALKLLEEAEEGRAPAAAALAKISDLDLAPEHQEIFRLALDSLEHKQAMERRGAALFQRRLFVLALVALLGLLALALVWVW